MAFQHTRTLTHTQPTQTNKSASDAGNDDGSQESCAWGCAWKRNEEYDAAGICSRSGHSCTRACGFGKGDSGPVTVDGHRSAGSPNTAPLLGLIAAPPGVANMHSSKYSNHSISGSSGISSIKGQRKPSIAGHACAPGARHQDSKAANQAALSKNVDVQDEDKEGSGSAVQTHKEWRNQVLAARQSAQLPGKDKEAAPPA